MKPNLSLPKGKALIISASLISLLLIAIVLLFLSHRTQITPQSTFELNFKENKFNFSTNLTASDRKNAESIVGELALPEGAINGFQFTLDSTSSAKLAFSAPVTSNLTLSSQEVRFSGQTSQPLVNSQFKPKNFNVPQEVLLKAFGPNLDKFFLSRLNIPTELNAWLSENFQNNLAQYFLIFPNADMAIAAQDLQVDFSSLKNINIKDTEYKEDSDEDITYYLFKLPKNKDGQETTLTFFKISDLSIIANSQKAAKEIVGAIKSKEKSTNFIDDTAETSFYLDFKNPQKKLDPAVKVVFFNDNGQSAPKEKIFQTLEKLSEFKITLKASTFSGLINW